MDYVEYLQQINFQCPPPCTGCGQPIHDEFILRVQGHMWHAQCLRCAACQTSLTHTCYVRGSRVFCRMDFFRLFGASCAGCGQVIPPSEVVRCAHDNIYHTGCFVCVLCSSPLNTGDEFYLRDDARLICKADFHKARDSNRQDEQEGASQDSQYLGQQPSPSSLTSLTFTPQETETLQEVYRACPNPPHDTLQRISRQHGLDVTRVRVWFHVHRKENGARDGGTSYGAADNVCGVGDGGGGAMERAVAPPGGYPLPIVNEVSCASSGRLPTPSRSGFTLGDDVPFPVTCPALPKQPCAWPLSEDVWRPDFVPPNVDLNPCDIKNGEVCSSRRGFPPTAASPSAERPFGFHKGSDCPPGQGHGAMTLSWINC